jgi:tetratricopeptide (TPR) repeat protein
MGGLLSPRAALVPLLLAGAGCAQYAPFDSAGHLRQAYATQLGPERARTIGVPFELDETVIAFLDRRFRPSGSEAKRATDIVDFVFQDLGLEYSLWPTRDAVATFHARQANCLSFVNLFVGISRRHRLDSFYVEVSDARRWSHAQGTVVSQGHIVAGLTVGGELRTYDFLPYRSKPYRIFKPIDDVTAAAHFYNNLAAEALLDGRLEEATRFAVIAAGIAPRFPKALNNLGVAHARRGDFEAAEAVYRQGLEVDPEDPGLLTNLLRLHQQAGRRQEAEEIVARLERLEISSPHFLVYRGREELYRGSAARAIELLRQALRLESELPDVHVALAEAYLAAGDLARARHYARRALALDATSREARRLLTMIGERGEREGT